MGSLAPGHRPMDRGSLEDQHRAFACGVLEGERPLAERGPPEGGAGTHGRRAALMKTGVTPQTSTAAHAEIHVGTGTAEITHAGAQTLVE